VALAFRARKNDGYGTKIAAGGNEEVSTRGGAVPPFPTLS
jgi:hypothetical protein